MRIDASDDGVVLNLGQVVNFSTVEKDLEILRRVLEIKQPVVFDAETVQQIDSAGLQLLYAFMGALKDAQLTYTWQKVSEEFRHAADLMGFASDALWK